MRFTLDQTTLFRDAERARFARYFGKGLFEPVFHDATRGPLPVRAHMRDTWLAEADRIIERQAIQLRWVGFEAIAIGVVLVAAASIILPLAAQAAPILQRIPIPVAAAPALLWPLVHELRYRARLRGLRRSIGDRLCVRNRVDARFVGVGTKYNVFAGLSGLLTVLVFGWGMVGVIRHDVEWNMTPALVLLPIIWTLHFAARRIDRNQRRPLPKA